MAAAISLAAIQQGDLAHLHQIDADRIVDLVVAAGGAVEPIVQLVFRQIVGGVCGQDLVHRIVVFKRLVVNHVDRGFVNRLRLDLGD